MADIIVVDSEPTVRLVITRILERSGHFIRATGDVEEAIGLVRERKPDLVVTNVCIRGVPGFDAMTRIREEFPSVVILMVPGLPDDEAIRLWMGEPGFDIFPKPFTSEALTEKVRQVLTGA